MPGVIALSMVIFISALKKEYWKTWIFLRLPHGDPAIVCCPLHWERSSDRARVVYTRHSFLEFSLRGKKKKRINFSLSINLGGKGLCLLRLGCFTVSVLNHTAAGLIWVGSIDWTGCEGNWYGSSQPWCCYSTILIWMFCPWVFE